jgi:hypothetical protein
VLVKRRTRLLVAALFLPVLVSCGGASDEQATPQERQHAKRVTAPGTRADLIADAKKICARMDARIGRLGLAVSQATPQQMSEIMDAWRVTVDELRVLKPPPTEARRFGRMLTHFEAAIRAARALPHATDEMALVPIAEMADDGMKGGKIAHAYGLDECSLFAPGPTRAEFEQYILEQARKEGGLRARQ